MPSHDTRRNQDSGGAIRRALKLHIGAAPRQAKSLHSDGCGFDCCWACERRYEIRDRDGDYPSVADIALVPFCYA